MSANPRQPYTHQLHRSTVLFGRTPPSTLASFQIPGGQGASRCSSQTLPRYGSSACLPCLSCPIVTLGTLEPALPLYDRMPSSCVSSYFGLVTLSRSPCSPRSILFFSERAPYRAGSEGHLFSVHSFDRFGKPIFCHHTIFPSRTAVSTSHIPLITHSAFCLL